MKNKDFKILMVLCGIILAVLLFDLSTISTDYTRPKSSTDSTKIQVDGTEVYKSYESVRSCKY